MHAHVDINKKNLKVRENYTATEKMGYQLLIETYGVTVTGQNSTHAL